MVDFIKTTFHRLIQELDIDTYRYLYPKFNINNRLTGIIGPRGVGKTTLMLQYIKNHLYGNNKVFYFSADHIYFNDGTLLSFIEELYRSEGISIFFIDEIHKYKKWNQEIKNIYDAFPSIKIIFSGSSSIDLVKGSYDLSRRATLFHLHGLSFREYLNFKTGSQFNPIPFDQMLTHYAEYDASLSLIPKIKGHFKDYLEKGYYPFLFEDQYSYYEKIERIIGKMIFEDIANYYNLHTTNLGYFKKILKFLASIPPGHINIHNLSQNLGIDGKTAYNYLNILEETELVRFIYPYQGGNQQLKKPEKIFLNNTTLLYALNNYVGQDASMGTVRELFFIQSIMNTGKNIFYSKMGDFQTATTVFEIGGKNKKRQQIKHADLPAILVKDDIFVTSQNTIPLFYFGFLY